MAEEENKDAKSKKDLGKLVGLLLVVLNLIGVGAGVFLAYMGTLGSDMTAILEEFEKKTLAEKRKFMEDNPIVYSMEAFVVNLNGEPSRTINLEISLEMLSEEGFENVITTEAEARDNIVRILNSKSFIELETIQGKLFLKDQIASSINSIIKNGVVKDIYFTKFVVQ